MTQPLNRTARLPALGKVDEAAGEFWVENPFLMPLEGKNLSAFERNRLFLGLDGRSFIDASFASAADIDADSRSVVAADFNQDGSVDLLVGSVGGGPLRLFLNRLPQGNSVRVRLRGTTSNRAGVGARVVIHCGSRQIVRDLFPVNPFMGQSPVNEMLIGVGDAGKIDELHVRWPTGKIQIVKDVAVGQPGELVEVVEAE